MRRIGEVTAIYGDMLEITFCRPADCGKCHACIGGSNQAVIRLKGTASVGDVAVVEMPAETVIKASLIAYVIPLIGLVAGAILGSTLGDSDTMAALCGLAGLALTGGVVVFGEKKRRADAQWQPVLTQILPAKEATAVKEEN